MHATAQPGGMFSSIPMHQPRPQKAVSVAGIDSPAAFHFKGPQQQQELPFHQQVPTHMANSYGDDQIGPPIPQPVAGGIPLSQIPEGTAFVPGFQPYPMMGGPAYFGAPYVNGAMFPPPVNDSSGYALHMGDPTLAPNFIPGSQAHHAGYMPASAAVEGGMLPNMVAQESNGMVFYYNPPMFPPDSHGGYPMVPNGNMLANGMVPQHQFYYPSMPTSAFYPAQSG
jgi:hypothetical protein